MIYLYCNNQYKPQFKVKAGETMTDKQLRYINRLTVFVRKLLKLVPQDKREELENEFDSILLEVTEPDNNN